MEERNWLDELKELKIKNPFSHLEIEWFESQIALYHVWGDYTVPVNINTVICFMFFIGRISGDEVLQIRKIIRKGLENG